MKDKSNNATIPKERWIAHCSKERLKSWAPIEASLDKHKHRGTYPAFKEALLKVHQEAFADGALCGYNLAVEFFEELLNGELPDDESKRAETIRTNGLM